MILETDGTSDHKPRRGDISNNLFQIYEYRTKQQFPSWYTFLSGGLLVATGIKN
jgi:hypothetical protein